MRGTTVRYLGALALLASLMVATPAVTSAEEKTCRGTIGGRTLDNVRVPDGATCRLNGTRVQGTIQVETGATLKAFDVRVIGNVLGENARKVVVAGGSRIGGRIAVVQSRRVRVAHSRINGDILIDENRRPNAVIDNVVGGSVQAFQNTGGVEIRSNEIDGNLQCKANRPRPIGGRNVVQGNKEDQCARL